VFLHALLREKSAQDSQAIKVILSLDKAKKILKEIAYSNSEIHVSSCPFLDISHLRLWQICGYWSLAESIGDPINQRNNEMLTHYNFQSMS